MTAPASVRAVRWTPAAEQEVSSAVRAYLAALGRGDLADTVEYIALELAGNAAKANLKRVYLDEKRVDPADAAAYARAMGGFKREMAERADQFAERLARSGYEIAVQLAVTDGRLLLSVSNNAAAFPVELERMRGKIAGAARFQGLENIEERGLDATEGGGLGLTLAVLLLRALGLDTDCLQVVPHERATVVQLVVPLDLLSAPEQDAIADAIAAEIEGIPQLPAHVIELQRVVRDPRASFDRLAALIRDDAALVAETLRVANSAAFGQARKLTTIEEAVRLLGFRGVGELALACATRALLSDRYRVNLRREFDEHATRVAQTAARIARLWRREDAAPEAFSAGMLHDVGRLIAFALMPEAMERLRRVVHARGVNPALLERLTSGYNHALIGERLAEKWNFPEALVAAIRHHHQPLEAPLAMREVAMVVHVADVAVHYLKGEYRYGAVLPEVLARCGTRDESAFRAFCQKATEG